MNEDIKNDILSNFVEFCAAADTDLAAGRYNAAVSSYFKALSILCDWHIYKRIMLLPKNHTERFQILERDEPQAYSLLSPLFSKYRDSYNTRLSRKDALELSENVKKLKKLFGIEG